MHQRIIRKRYNARFCTNLKKTALGSSSEKFDICTLSEVLIKCMEQQNWPEQLVPMNALPEAAFACTNFSFTIRPVSTWASLTPAEILHLKIFRGAW